jgi:hypothetical protein
MELNNLICLLFFFRSGRISSFFSSDMGMLTGRDGATIQLQAIDSTVVVRHRGFSLGSNDTHPSVGAISKRVDITVLVIGVVGIIPAHWASGGRVNHDDFCGERKKGDGCMLGSRILYKFCAWATPTPHVISRVLIAI